MRKARNVNIISTPFRLQHKIEWGLGYFEVELASLVRGSKDAEIRNLQPNVECFII